MLNYIQILLSDECKHLSNVCAVLCQTDSPAVHKKKKKSRLSCPFSVDPVVYYLISLTRGRSHAQWTQTTWPIEYPTDCVISACWIKNKHMGWFAFLEGTGIKWEDFPPSCTVYLASFTLTRCSRTSCWGPTIRSTPEAMWLIHFYVSIPLHSRHFHLTCKALCGIWGSAFPQSSHNKKTTGNYKAAGRQSRTLMKVRFPLPQVSAQRDYICETITLSQSKEAAFKWTVKALGGA